MQRELHISQYDSIFTKQMSTDTAEWSDIVQFLQQYKLVGRKEDGSLFSGVKWLDSTSPDTKLNKSNIYSRCTDNALGLDLLILDFDNAGCTRDKMIFSIDQVKAEFKDYEYVCYTSFNHQNPAKDNGVDKFRVVIPLSEYCPKDQWIGRIESFKAKFAHLHPDDAGWRIAQPMYIPIMHPDRVASGYAWHNTGAWFDWTKYVYKNPDEIKVIRQTQSKLSNESVGMSLNANSILVTKKGSFRLGDITGKVSGVKCPFHFDNKPSEFVAVSPTSGVPFLSCKKCGTIWMDDDDDKLNDKFLDFVKKHKKTAVKNILVWDETTQDSIVLEYNSDRYIEQNSKLDFDNYEVVFIKAPKGSGKTELINSVVEKAKKNRKKIILLGHRRFLISNLAQRLGLDDYQEKDKITNAYALSVDSLSKLKPRVSNGKGMHTGTDTPFDIVIIDESEQVIQHFISQTFKNNRGTILTNLLWLLGTAKQLICLDADLSKDITIDIMQWMGGFTNESTAYGFINTWKATGTVELYDNKNHMLALMLQDVLAGKNVFVPVGSVTLAENIQTILARPEYNIPSTQILCLTAKTNDSDQAKAFIKMPSNECKKYRVVIASPTLSTGVSIEGTHFDCIYGFFNNRVYTYQDCDQAISRVRKCDQVRVWIQSGNVERRLLESSLKKSILEKEGITRSLIYTHDEDRLKLSKGEGIYLNAYARILCMQNLWKRDKREKFTKLKQQNGFDIVDVKVKRALKEEGAALLDYAKSINHNKEVKLIFNAEIIADYEYLDYKDNKLLPQNMQNSIKRYSIAIFLGDIPISEENISDTIKNDLMSKAAKIKNVITDDGLLLARDKNEREKREVLSPDSKHRFLDKNIFDIICNMLEIDFVQLYSDAHEYSILHKKVLDAEINSAKHSRQHRAAIKNLKEAEALLLYEIPSSILDKLSQYMADNLVSMNKALGTNFRKPTDAHSKVKVWNAIFDNYGLRLKKQRVRTGGADENRYVIDYSYLLIEKFHQFLVDSKAKRVVAIPTID